MNHVRTIELTLDRTPNNLSITEAFFTERVELLRSETDYNLLSTVDSSYLTTNRCQILKYLRTRDERD
ncbi:MAG: hypothetical protein N5P05_004603 (plasmid) [Chroococcopsis gigantea SAG 12.99]|jgi:hypothetical protein|nr:hypothetical protein [Chroococcopsis gigantea SAG 12.99]